MALTKISRGLLNTGVSDSSDATAITITSGEKVLLGTSTASSSAGARLVLGGSEENFIQFSSSNNLGGVIGVTSSGNIPFYTHTGAVGSESFSERMRITSSGNVGIGITSPDYKLVTRDATTSNYISVIGATNGNAGIAFGDDNAKLDGGILFKNDTGALRFFKSGFTEAARIDSSGNFLHGGTSVFTTGVTSLRSRTLSGNDFAEVACGGEYATTDTYLVYDTTNNATRFKVNYQGTVYAAQTTIQSLSDERLKENVRDLDKGLADILKLKPRRFDWKAEEGSGKTDVTGFIAQECETAGFEEFVDTVDFSEANKNVKTFGYGGLIPALVKAIQELSTKLEAAEARITTLEG